MHAKQTLNAALLSVLFYGAVESDVVTIDVDGRLVGCELVGAAGCFEWGRGQTVDACCLTHAACLIAGDQRCILFAIHDLLAHEVRTFSCQLLAKS